MQKLQALGAIIAVGGSCAAAVANIDLASFSYDSLAGTYVETGGAGSGVGTFSALAVNRPGLRSSGIVSRLVSPLGDARFPSGFTSNALAGLSAFSLNLSVNVTGVNVASGVGTFNIVDVDGDQLTGVINGQWSSQTANFITFQGALTNVVFVDNGIADNQFNGLVGAVQMSPFPAPSPFTGALVQLTFGAPSFFGTGFQNRNTGVSAQVIPAPAALALLGMGGLVAGRRRR